MLLGRQGRREGLQGSLLPNVCFLKPGEHLKESARQVAAEHLEAD